LGNYVHDKLDKFRDRVWTSPPPPSVPSPPPSIPSPPSTPRMPSSPSQYQEKTDVPTLPKNPLFLDLKLEYKGGSTPLEQLRLSLEYLLQQQEQLIVQLENNAKEEKNFVTTDLSNTSKHTEGDSLNTKLKSRQDKVSLLENDLVSENLSLLKLSTYPSAQSILKAQIQFQNESYTEFVQALKDLKKNRISPLEIYQVENHLPVMCKHRQYHAGQQPQRCYKDPSHGRFCSRCYYTCPVCLAENSLK